MSEKRYRKFSSISLPSPSPEAKEIRRRRQSLSGNCAKLIRSGSKQAVNEQLLNSGLLPDDRMDPFLRCDSGFLDDDKVLSGSQSEQNHQMQLDQMSPVTHLKVATNGNGRHQSAAGEVRPKDHGRASTFPPRLHRASVSESPAWSCQSAEPTQAPCNSLRIVADTANAAVEEPATVPPQQPLVPPKPLRAKRLEHQSESPADSSPQLAAVDRTDSPAPPPAALAAAASLNDTPGTPGTTGSGSKKRPRPPVPPKPPNVKTLRDAAVGSTHFEWIVWERVRTIQASFGMQLDACWRAVASASSDRLSLLPQAAACPFCIALRTVQQRLAPSPCPALAAPPQSCTFCRLLPLQTHRSLSVDLMGAQRVVEGMEKAYSVEHDKLKTELAAHEEQTARLMTTLAADKGELRQKFDHSWSMVRAGSKAVSFSVFQLARCEASGDALELQRRFEEALQLSGGVQRTVNDFLAACRAALPLALDDALHLKRAFEHQHLLLYNADWCDFAAKQARRQALALANRALRPS